MQYWLMKSEPNVWSIDQQKSAGKKGATWDGVRNYQAANNLKKMEKVINYLTGFFGGLMAIMMSIIPVTILWYVLTGGDVWGMDVITNLTALVNNFGTGGFSGLVVLVLLATFFVKK